MFACKQLLKRKHDKCEAELNRLQAQVGERNVLVIAKVSLIYTGSHKTEVPKRLEFQKNSAQENTFEIWKTGRTVNSFLALYLPEGKELHNTQ